MKASGDQRRFATSTLFQLLLVVALVLGACGGAGSDETDESTTTGVGEGTTSSTESAAEPQTLTVWMHTLLTDAEKNLTSSFAEASGHTLNVEVIPQPYEQNVLARWAAGERPDILYWHAIGNWVVQLAPEENLFAFNDEAFVSNYAVEGFIENAGSHNGQIYAAVIGYPYLDGLFFNRPVFDALGVEVPRSFDELVDVCQTIQEEMPEVTPLVQGGGDIWPLQVLPFIMWNDAIQTTDLIEELNTNQVDWTDERIVQGIEKQKQLINDGCFNDDIVTATFEDEQTRLMEGSAAMVINGSWIVEGLLAAYDQAEIDEAVGFAPISAETDVTSWQAGTGLFVPKTGDADKEAAAHEFIRYATSDGYAEYLEATRSFPVFNGYPEPEDPPIPWVEANEAFKTNAVPQFQQTLLASYGFFETFLHEMVSGTKTPLEVAESLEVEFERSAAAIGLEGFGG